MKIISVWLVESVLLPYNHTSKHKDPLNTIPLSQEQKKCNWTVSGRQKLYRNSINKNYKNFLREYKFILLWRTIWQYLMDLKL